MMAQTSKISRRSWILWIALNAVIFGYFGYAFVAPTSTVKAALLPGKTTHGHYQIELNCSACHDAAQTDEEHSSANVMQNACIRCHGNQLDAANDTHPAKKFNDPSNAELLETLDAQDCLTCHREHVPDQTTSMGLSLPTDYCWHCHQDVGESRPSHADMKFDSCATAGCHNYHDNRAIYEKYLDDHFGEPDFLDNAVLPQRNLLEMMQEAGYVNNPLRFPDADASEELLEDQQLVIEWSQTAHAAAGVNCSGCHSIAEPGDSAAEGVISGKPMEPLWSNEVAMDTCQRCHNRQVETFLTGKHGMRIAQNMTPMDPSHARLPMHSVKEQTAHQGDAHKQLTCNACHSGHRFDTEFASVTACQSCHADSHSMAYSNSSHALLWQQELAGELPEGSGVTCATCHLPRLVGDETSKNAVWVNHDQNAVLRPNDTMARQVCSHCHGLDFSLSSLSDPELMLRCYDGPPQTRTKSVEMAHDYFEQRRQKRKRRTTKSN